MNCLWSIVQKRRILDINTLVVTVIVKEKAVIYHVNDSCFCLVFNSLYDQQLDRIMEQMMEQFEKPWLINDISTLLSAHLCRIECPEDAADVKEYFKINFLSLIRITNILKFPHL